MGIRICYCMRLVLSEDLGNVNPKHENLYVYMWNAITDDMLMTLRWNDVDVNDNINMR